MLGSNAITARSDFHANPMGYLQRLQTSFPGLLELSHGEFRNSLGHQFLFHPMGHLVGCQGRNEKGSRLLYGLSRSMI